MGIVVTKDKEKEEGKSKDWPFLPCCCDCETDQEKAHHRQVMEPLRFGWVLVRQKIVTLHSEREPQDIFLLGSLRIVRLVAWLLFSFCCIRSAPPSPQTRYLLLWKQENRSKQCYSRNVVQAQSVTVTSVTLSNCHCKQMYFITKPIIWDMEKVSL